MPEKEGPKIPVVSSDSDALSGISQIGLIAKPRNGSQGVSQPHVLRELAELRQECAQGNWDGFGALAVSEEVGTWADMLLRSLPPEIEAPSLSAEPDGMISLEWYRSPKRILSVSVAGDGTLHYAVLCDTKEGHGEFPPSCAWPKALLDWSREVLAG